MDSNALSIATYLGWKDDAGYDGDHSMCFNCYCQKHYWKTDQLNIEGVRNG